MASCLMLRLWGLPTLGLIGLTFALISLVVGLVQVQMFYNTTPASEWIMVGGMTESSANFRIVTPTTATLTAFSVSLRPDQTEPVWYETQLTPVQSMSNATTTTGLSTLYETTVTGLQPSTLYYYALIHFNNNNKNQTLQQGSFRTSPPLGQPTNFTFATSYGAWTGSQTKIYDRIRQHDPLFFLHTGDFHYADIQQNDLQLRFRAVGQSMGSNSLRNFLLHTPLVYMWDDHDYLGNNAGYQESEPGARQTALLSYDWFFPHHPLAQPDPNRTGGGVAPYHAFTVGTVRFILTDLRSEATESAIYFDEQRQWFYNELRLAAKNSSGYDFVVWVSTKPWIGTQKPGSDSWRGNFVDRAELSTLISNLFADKQNFLAIGSDAHMVGFDDGRNTYYGNATTDDTESFPMVYSGPLDRLGSVKGGPFSNGCHATRYERNHHYSVIGFEIGNQSRCVVIRSLNGNGNVLVNKRLCTPFFQSTTAQPKGSCQARPLSSGSTALLSIALVLIVLVSVAGCVVFRNHLLQALGLCTVLVLTWFLTVVVGLGVTPLRGVPHLETFTALLMGLVQTMVSSLFCAYWFYNQVSGRQEGSPAGQIVDVEEPNTKTD